MLDYKEQMKYLQSKLDKANDKNNDKKGIIKKQD